MYDLRLIDVFELDLGIECPATESAFLAVDQLTQTLFIAIANNVYQSEYTRTFLSDACVPLDIDINSTIVGMEYLADQAVLFVITSSGDVLTYDPLSCMSETVGCVSSGLLCGSWSPDFELVVLISGEHSLLIMNREFDVLVDISANPTQAGVELHETVGWGKKETQFQGSAGKQAAFEKPEECTAVCDGDSLKPEISWRGDGLYFCVSTVCPQTAARVIRVWSRDGQLSSTCEPTHGLQHNLSWKPSGSVIASSRRKETIEVVLYERNGYRHGNIPLKMDANYIVRSLHWNCDSTIFSAVMQNVEDNKTYVNLYTCRNMYWSLKQSIGMVDGVVCVCWDSEKPMVIHGILANGVYMKLHFQSYVAWDHTHNATTAVIDADCIKVTPFIRALVPPPMSLYTFKCDALVSQVSFIPKSQNLYCFLNDFMVELWSFNTENDGYVKERSIILNRSKWWIYHFICIDEGTVAWTEYEGGVCSLIVANLCESTVEVRAEQKLDGNVLSLQAVGNTLYLLSGGGYWKTVTLGSVPAEVLDPKQKPMHSRTPSGQNEVYPVGNQIAFISVSSSHILTVNNEQLSTSVACFLTHPNFLLYTTLQHQLFCIPWQRVLQMEDIKCDGREIERGSALIACTESMLILQAPRGNLETIHPRPLLLRIISQLIDEKRYRETLIGMKRHRINSNLLFDHNPQMFLNNLDHFVSSIKEPLTLELFLSEIKDEDTSLTLYKDNYPDRAMNDSFVTIPDKQYKICGAIRQILCKMDTIPVNLLPSLLITYVRQGVHLIEDALLHVKKIAAVSGDAASVYDSAIGHLLYLVDAQQLYTIALGTYDFELVLLVAEKSHKDPKEYIAFLNELKSVEPDNMRRYRIDMHLQRYVKALQSLVIEDDNTFDMFVTLMVDKSLYTAAMKMWPRTSSSYKKICELYGDYLSKRRHDKEASVVYEVAACYKKALVCAVNCADCKSVLRLANLDKLDRNEYEYVLNDLVQKLVESKEFEKAGQICENESRDFERALELYCDGFLWDAATLICVRYNLDAGAMVERLVQHTNSSIQQFDSMREQLCTLTARLSVVRNEKRDKWDRICQGEDLDDTRSEAFSEASSVRSALSTSTNRTTSTMRSSRLNRKQEKKRVTLKEGSRFEDIALLVNIRASIVQVNALQSQVGHDIGALLLNGEDVRAHKLHASFKKLHSGCSSSISLSWPTHWKPYEIPGPIDPSCISQFGDISCTNPGFEGLLLDDEIKRPSMDSSKCWDMKYLLP